MAAVLRVLVDVKNELRAAWRFDELLGNVVPCDSVEPWRELKVV